MRALFSILTMLFVTLSGCGAWDYAVELPNGYELIRCNADNIAIWSPKQDLSRRCVVPALIAGLNVHKDIVYGKVDISPNPDLESVPGFFILDTKNGSVELGLEKEDWLKALRDFGISKVPVLKPPSRYFSW